MAALVVTAGLGLVAAPVSAGAAVTPAVPPTPCPAIGASPGCEILLVVNSDNTVSVLGDPTIGPYDGSDDTLVGIVNNSTRPVNAVTVSGPGSGLSLFDGDGICSGQFGTWDGSASCPYGPSGYEGPGTSFVTDSSLPDSAEVDFTGGLAPNASAYFSLEGALTSATLSAREGHLTCDFVGGDTNPDYCIPADWNAHTLSTSPSQGMEPLNLIYSARSTVPFATVLDALPDWAKVFTGAPPLGCLSEEDADVTGTGAVGQDQSWRQSRLPGPILGCLGGVRAAEKGVEDHARIWSQPLPNSSATAWFITASVERECKITVVDPGTGEKSKKLWHCIQPHGYNNGADELAFDIVNTARHNGWTVTTRLDTRAPGTSGSGANSGPGTGLNGITYSGTVEVITITTG